jgi:nucleotidyltransferase substrate binding protein (TIGR01987 family)
MNPKMKQQKTYIIDGINIQSLLNAFAQFEEFRCNTGTNQLRAGAIQAFEFSYEQAWKIMKRLLDARGQNLNSPREVFRAAALEKFIDDLEEWIEYMYVRNLTAHTYNDGYAAEVVDKFDEFSKLVKEFLNKIGIDDATY